MSKYPVIKGTSPTAKMVRDRRAAVHAMTGGRCFYCGLPVFLEEKPSGGRDWMLPRGDYRMIIEHKTPMARGGNDLSENHVPACKNCNSSKSALTIEEYRFVRGLRFGTLSFKFYGEAPHKPRDWLCCHSRPFERVLVQHNFPDGIESYGRGKLPRP